MYMYWLIRLHKLSRAARAAQIELQNEKSCPKLLPVLFINLHHKTKHITYVESVLSCILVI